MNIYGDMKICTKCDMKADVVENGKDYCAECWWKRFSNTGTTLKNYEKKKQEEMEQQIERTKSNQKKV